MRRIISASSASRMNSEGATSSALATSTPRSRRSADGSQRLRREQPTQRPNARLRETVELQANRAAFLDLAVGSVGLPGQKVRDQLVQLWPVPDERHALYICVARERVQYLM